MEGQRVLLRDLEVTSDLDQDHAILILILKYFPFFFFYKVRIGQSRESS